MRYGIVEPQYYDIAAEVYERLKGAVHSAGIVNTAKMSEETETVSNNMGDYEADVTD